MAQVDIPMELGAAFWEKQKAGFAKTPKEDGPVKKDYIAREVSGEERDLWWERSVAAFPDYANYQTKTERVIPVFVLTETTAD